MKGIGKRKKRKRSLSRKLKKGKERKEAIVYDGSSADNQASEQKVNTVSCQLCVDIQEKMNKNRPSLI